MPVPTNEMKMSDLSMENTEKQVAAPNTDGGRSLRQKESMILVQVNPGETFTIQAEDGTQCIQGPAQVPMVSPNGAIPPIHVPHGYISQVIEENGLRRVVVIPTDALMPHSHFTGTPGGGQPVLAPQPGMQHLSMQPGPPMNYMQQMNMMSLSQQSPLYHASGEHLPVFHPQPMTYIQADGSISADPSPIPNLPQFHNQYQFHPAEMDPASSNARASKAKERLQKKLQERHNHQHSVESNKNISPTSVSPSSSSSYAATPSPNSSPDSSPRIMGGSVPMPHYANGYGVRKGVPGYMPQLLGSPQHYHQHSHTQCYTAPTNCCPRNSKAPQLPTRPSNSDDMSSGSSSSGGSPRRLPSGVHRVPAVPPEVAHQYQANIHQQDITFHSNAPQEPFPMIDGKNNLKEFLSAITKPELCETAPRSAHIKWSMRFSLPKEMESFVKEQKIIYEVFLSDKGKDSMRFRSIYRDTNAYFVIRDLKPGMEYHTRVLAELKSLKGSHSEITSFRTVSCPPDTPGAPKCVHRTKNSLTLKWAAPNDNGEKILKYRVEWDEGKKGSGFRSLYCDTQKQYKVVKLQPSHYYTFRLSSDNKMGSSPWSPEVTYSTSGTAPNVPDPPRLAKAYVRSLVLTWTRVPGGSGDAGSGYVRFTLEMDNESSGYGFRVVYDGTDNRATVKNLNRSTLYKFRLCAYNNDGKSNYSDVVTYLTLPDKPGVPGKVMLRGKAHPTWFKVAWDPPKDAGGADITKYVLEYSHERGQPMNTIYSGPEKEFSLENTMPGVQYRLRVHCVSDGGSSMPSEVTVITPPAVVPGPCAPPRTSSKAKPTLIYLRWDPPNYNGGSTVLSYEVAMDNPSQSFDQEGHESGAVVHPESLRQVYQGSALDCIVGGLRPGMVYKFAVRAANKVGNGPWSDRVELGTSAGPPDKPDMPEAELVTSYSVLLSWKEPRNNGSEITNYAIEWGSVNDTMSLQQTNSCLSHNFQHLSPNTGYFFRVQAQNAVGKSSYSDVAAITTSPSCPDRVPRVWQGDLAGHVTQDGEDDDLEEENYLSPAVCAMVAWEVPPTNGSEITSYLLEVTPLVKSNTARKRSQPSEEESVILTADGEDTSYLIQDLQPDTEYRIRVKAVSDMGQGAVSAPVTIETQPLPPEPPFLECSCSYNGLKLKWGSDFDPFNTMYLLQMKEKHGRFVTIYNGSGRSYRINRLCERTTYHLRINAWNHAGEGPFSPVYTFTTSTAPPPQLKHLPSVTVKRGIAEITWEEVERGVKGDPVSYIVNIEDCEDSSDKQSFTSPRAALNFGPLEPGSKYKVQVAAVRHIFPPPVEPPNKPTKQTESTSTDDDNVNEMGETEQEPNSESQKDSDKESVQDEVERPESEQVVGIFSNWMSFEVPLPKPTEMEPEELAGPDPQSSTLLKVTPSSMSDERKGALLLAAFFIFAVLLAFLVQCLVS